MNSEINMDSENFNEEIIYKYLAGDATEDEIHQINKWLDEHKSNRLKFSSIKKIFIETSSHLSDKEDFGKLAHEKFLQRVEETYTLGDYEDGKGTKNKILRVLQYAALILLFIGVGFGGYFIGNGFEESNTYSEIIVPYGSRTNVILPDGTKLWLNAGSKLKYNKIFNKGFREVFLEGEAYFEVEKNKIPFIVHTSHFDIRVLGTTFNVKSYAEEENIETTLVEGSILVETSKNTKPLELKPHQKLVYSKFDNISKVDSLIIPEGLRQNANNHDINQTKDVPELNQLKTRFDNKVGIIENDVDIEKSICWKDGTLIFDRESLENLSKKLERKFNITIEFENDKIKTNSFTGTLRDIPLEQVLEALKLTSEINYRIKGKVVTLY